MHMKNTTLSMLLKEILQTDVEFEMIDITLDTN